MDKKVITSYFDKLATKWDEHNVTDDEKIKWILDVAGVKAATTILDVACGTGVLFPYYLDRNVSHVIGVDISGEMTRIARSKIHDSRVEVICADIETLPIHTFCDSCIVYNAFPHFLDPKRLIARLAEWVKPEGHLTIAHSMGLEALRKHHAGRAEHVSREMLSKEELANILHMSGFEVCTMVSDVEKYLVSGVRLDTV